MRVHLQLLLAVSAVVVLILTPARAAQRSLTVQEIDEAIRVGQTRIAADRARFHAPYRIPVSRAPVDFIDIVTPYRRVVLAADERAQLGDRSFGQRQALELLTAAGGRFDVVVELTFHPLNTYVAIPQYDVTILQGSRSMLPATLDRQPRFGARVEGLPPAVPVPGIRLGGSQPMLGGTLTARFEGDAIDVAGLIDLIVSEQGKELARVRVDLARLR